MAPPVFISYARRTSRPYAEALYRSLEGAAFLDEPLIEFGDEFPRGLTEALLGSRVVVIFADEAYFESWYCQWELRAILEPFVARALEASEMELHGALAHIVWARPADGERIPEQRLPPLLEVTHWPSARETEALKKLVRQRLEVSTVSLADRLSAVARLDSTKEALRRRVLLKRGKPRAHAPCFPHSLPNSRGDAFIGRENELWLLDILLSDGGGAPVALEGGPGMGKSQLALEYFHRAGPSRFPGGRFWVSAEVSSDALILQWYGILRELRPDAPGLEVLQRGDVRANLEGLLGRAFGEAAGRGPILFVVDNLPEPSPGEPEQPLSTWCPALNRVTLLATSRYRYSAKNVFVHPLPVGTLVPRAAVELLTCRLELAGVRRTELDDGQWRHIAMRVGHLPLALDLLRGAMASKRITPTEFLERIEAEGPAARSAASVLGPDAPGVFKVFEISYLCLPDEAKHMARVLARLAPEPIPERLWKAFGPELATGEVRSALVMHSFISPGGGDDSVRMLGGMHRLLAEFLCGCSTGQEAAEEEEGVYQALERVLSERAADPLERAEKDACVAHAEWLVLRFDALGQVGETSAFWTFAHSFNVFLFDRGFWPRARIVGERVLAAAKELHGESHPLTRSAMGNLAATLGALGEAREARRLQEAVLEGSRKELGEGHPDTLLAMGNLALTLKALGEAREVREARRLEEAVLEGRRKELGERHPDTLSAMGSLAVTLEALGEAREARRLQEAVLEGRRKELGERHPDTLSAMGNLAVTLRALGEVREARRLEEAVLEGWREELGEGHLDTLSAMSNLALTLGALGEAREARRLQEAVLEGRRKELGERHPDTLSAMGNLALTLGALGEAREARRLQEAVLEGSRKELGEGHLDTLRAMGNLAVTLGALGEVREARRLEEAVLEGWREELGERHPDTLRAMGNLARSLKALGEVREARRLLEAVLEGRREELGERHPDTLSAMSNLAAFLWELGHWHEARALQEETLTKMRTVLGESHPNTLTSQANQDAMSRIPAGIEAQQGGGDFEDAQLFWKERVRLHGRSHPETLLAAREFARKLKERGQFQEARSLLEEVAEYKRAGQGETHPEVLAVMGELADVYLALGLFPQERELRARIRAASPETSGPPAPVQSPGDNSTPLGIWLFVGACVALIVYLLVRFA